VEEADRRGRLDRLLSEAIAGKHTKHSQNAKHKKPANILSRAIPSDGMFPRGMVVMLGAACGLWAQTPARPRISPEAIERGRAQFEDSSACGHGPNANGGTHGPSLIRSSIVRHDENGVLIGEVVRQGRPSQGMPAISLTTIQVADIVAFLQSRVAAAD